MFTNKMTYTIIFKVSSELKSEVINSSHSRAEAWLHAVDFLTKSYRDSELIAIVAGNHEVYSHTK